MCRTAMFLFAWLALATVASGHDDAAAAPTHGAQVQTAQLISGPLGAYLAGCLTGFVSGAILFVGVRRKPREERVPVRVAVEPTATHLEADAPFDEDSIPDETDLPARVAA